MARPSESSPHRLDDADNLLWLAARRNTAAILMCPSSGERHPAA